jgi:hypothetical protein
MRLPGRTCEADHPSVQFVRLAAAVVGLVLAGKSASTSGAVQHPAGGASGFVQLGQQLRPSFRIPAQTFPAGFSLVMGHSLRISPSITRLRGPVTLGCREECRLGLGLALWGP